MGFPRTTGVPAVTVRLAVGQIDALDDDRIATAVGVPTLAGGDADLFPGAGVCTTRIRCAVVARSTHEGTGTLDGVAGQAEERAVIAGKAARTTREVISAPLAYV